VKDTDADSLRRTAARRRAKNSAWRARLFSQPPLEGGGRKWIWAVAGVALLLLVTFVSGVRVGKELGRPSLKREAAVFLQDKAGQKIPIRVGEPGKGPSREEEGKAGSPESAEKIKTKEPAENKGKEQPPPAEKDSGSASKTALVQPPPAKVPPAPKAKYTLQIAALNSAEEAKELVAKLKSKGYDAYAVTGTAAAKGALHRVRIGSFPSLQEARQFAVEFEKKEKIKTIITSP
jgi:cell division septation protein DedD